MKRAWNRGTVHHIELNLPKRCAGYLKPAVDGSRCPVCRAITVVNREGIVFAPSHS